MKLGKPAVNNVQEEPTKMERELQRVAKVAIQGHIKVKRDNQLASNAMRDRIKMD